MFPTTHRSVLASLASDAAEERSRAYETLVAAYWKPVYKHVRLRWRRSDEDAKDLTQGFFAAALEKEFLAGYDAEKARFRTFLRVCLDRFVADDAAAARRRKRGGDVPRTQLDFDAAEAELARAAPPADPIEEHFDREWLRSVLALAVERLRLDCEARRRPKRFELFRRSYLDDAAQRPTYAALASEHGIAVTDVTNELSAARRELRRAVLAVLREITASDREFRAEARLVLGSDLP
ncbi:MAG TPA: sigma-70 family RNA polymerase sigma factor [Planctomycetota bacterium]|nr:sigma-70 family RNA polymerase sigma factor [Planctomycetota bacterium]